jgi:ribose transport system ATP-binding protein
MLLLRDVDKRFAATYAVKNVTLEASAGIALGLVGENGAGKSTLIKIASGIVRPDHGSVLLDGEPVARHGPRDALRHGIASVFQELTLVRSLTVEENLGLLDAPRTILGVINRRKLRVRARQLLDKFSLDLDPGAELGELPLGRQQMVEIVRAVGRSPRVLLLDEATSALGASEVDWLLGIVRRMKAENRTVLFISHRWNEVAQFCDHVAVMRNGELVAVSAASDLSQDRAVQLMTGRLLEATFPSRGPAGSAPLLKAENLCSHILRGVSLSLASGEILGLGGLIGQGQDALLKALFGEHRLEAGVIVVDGRAYRGLTIRQAIRDRIAYVPQERKTEGLLLSKSIAVNLTLAILRRLTGLLGFVKRAAEKRIAREAIDRLHISAASADEPVERLSGGNQQKVLLQKWLLARPKVLLLNDVTRGVDIGTKVQLYQLIAEIAAGGTGIVLYSTDTEELVQLCHRVLVMFEGAVSAELKSPLATADAIVRASISRRVEHAPAQ